MNYSEALAWLDGFINLERHALTRAGRAKITLARVRELAERLGNPQNAFPTLHVAGTKGKGSTCAFAASILGAAGLKTGLYTSPHLLDIRERIRIGDELISPDDFTRVLGACVPTLDEMRSRPGNGRRPTYFEVLTHLAFAWFAERRVDAAVIEVGLGGRLDATNIIHPVACGITNISLDHQAILGDTLAQIAHEKAGIIKRNVPVVVAPLVPEALAAVAETAEKRQAPLERVGHELPLRIEKSASCGAVWSGPVAELDLPSGTVRAQLALRGAHQAENWAIAVRLADHLHRTLRGTALPREAIEAGSLNVQWPGRLQELPRATGGPRVFLDGAHNDYSVGVILRELGNALGSLENVALVFGCAKDKDAAAMLRVVAAQEIHNVVFTHSGNVRGRAPEELAGTWRELTGKNALTCGTCADALRQAARMAGADGIVLVTGSLYLVGAAMAGEA